MAERFAEDIYPLMTRAEGGCNGCHGPDSGRMLSMGPTGTDTFYRLRSGGFLELGRTNSMLDRVSRTDETAMPQGGPYWSQAELNHLSCFVEQLAQFESAGSPPDESFPVELLEPYAGPPSTEYDNSFLTYEQLKGRIRVQFQDDWVRDSVDKFTENIALFGGVDFVTSFVPNRQPTTDYLLGLDMLAYDVCQQAATKDTGPFVGLDVTAPIVEEVPSTTQLWQAESTSLTRTGTCFYNVTNALGLCSTAGVGVTYDVPQTGTYTISAVAKGQEAGTELPKMSVTVDGIEVAQFSVPGTAWKTYTANVTINAGSRFLNFSFINDFYNSTTKEDRNLMIDNFSIQGPIPGTTDGAVGALQATRDRLSVLFEQVLLRSPQVDEFDDELEPLYNLLVALDNFDGDRVGAWAGVCEGLIKHPDFIFTRPPSFDTAPAEARERLLLVKTALDLMNRPPTFDELDRYDRGMTRRELIGEWLRSQDMRDAWFHWLRLRLESDGSPEMDEPARLWTWMMLNDRPIHELLTASYSVDANFEQAARSAVYGPTGLLTMKGYIKHKPGQPHYNYSARVLSDFLGYVFEVPPEIVDMRAGATPSSTVDPTTVCYSCHYLLTPFSYQRLRWDDEGNYSDVDANGAPIDDSDHDLVDDYPFKGSGMSSFAAQAVRKTVFTRTMANAIFDIPFGRPMRSDADERDLYYDLYTSAHDQQGGFMQLLEIILDSESYLNPVGSRPEDQAAYSTPLVEVTP